MGIEIISHEEAGEAAAGVIRRLFGRDLVYLLLWGIQIGAATAITPVIARMLGAEHFGVVALAIGVMQLLVAFGSLGLENAIQRRYAHDGEQVARRVMTLAVVTAITVTAVAYLSGPAWSPIIGFRGFPLSLRYAVVWAGATAITDAALALLRSRDHLRAFSTINLIQTAFSQLVSIGLLLALGRTADNYLLGQAATQLLAAGIGIALVAPLPLRRRDMDVVRGCFAYALPLVPSALAGFVVGSSNRLFVQHDLGSVAVGRFTIAYNIGLIPMLLLWSVTVSWMPRVLAVSHDDTRATVLGQTRDSVYALLIPMLVAFSAAAPLLLALWAPPSLRSGESATVLVVTLFAAVPYSAYLARSRGLMAAGASGVVGLSTAIGAGLNVVFNLALIPPLGIVGSALASLIAYGVMCLLLVALARRAAPLPRSNPVLLAGLGITTAVGGAFLLIPSGPPFAALRVATVLACVVTDAVLVLSLSGRGERFHLRAVNRQVDNLLGRHAH